MNKINTPIFIEYEIKSREFDGKLLLITHLLNAGFSKIYFGASLPLRTEAISHTNGVYFFKSVWKSEEILYKKLKEQGFILVLLHAEGGIYYKNNRSAIESSFNAEILDYFDYIFVYGNQIKEDIERIHGSQFKLKTIVTGEPRFDLLKPKYRIFFNDQLNRLKKKFNHYILINTSFSLANPHEGYTDLKKYFLDNLTFSQEAKQLYMLKMDFFPKVVNEFVKAINELALYFPNLIFVVRPHPSESENFYKEKFKGTNNIVVKKNGNVAAWILASLGVIHYDCTTGIEALLARKPVISYIPVKDDNVVAWLPIEASKKATELDDLLNEVNNIQKNEYDNTLDPVIKNILIDTINNFTSESAPLITNILSLKVCGSEKSLKTTNYLKCLILNINYNLKIILKCIVKRSNLSVAKFGKIDKKEIRKKIEVLQNILNFNNRVKIKRHTIHSYIICINKTK